MATYYRIQPKGKGLQHLSEDSAGEYHGLHVFDSPRAAVCCEEIPTVYGNEVVEIEAPGHRDNGDVEGVLIDPAKARITRRWTLNGFALEFFAAEIVERRGEDYPFGWKGLVSWYRARQAF
jgi:hypothetical protein